MIFDWLFSPWVYIPSVVLAVWWGSGYVIEKIKERLEQ